MRWVVLSLIFVFAFTKPSWGQQEAKVRDLLKASNALFLSNPDSCYTLCMMAAELVESSDSAELKAHVHNSLAAYYLQQADLDATAKNLDISLSFTEGTNSHQEAWSYKLKANLFRRLEEFEDALAFQDLALDIYLTNGDTADYLNTLVNSFLHYKSIGDTAGCRKSIETLDEYRSQIEGDLMYFYLQNKGDYLNLIGDYSKAEEYMLQAHGVTELEDMIDSRATILMMLGKNSMQMGNNEDAENYLNDAITLSNENHLNHEKLEAIEALLNLLLMQDRIEEAFEWQSKMYALKNDIYELEKINYIHGLEKKLEVSNYQKELSKKDAQIKQQELEEAKQDHRNQLLIIALVVLAVIGVTVTIGLIRMRVLKKVIEKQHAVVAEKNLQIQEALDDINDSLNYSQRLQHSLLPLDDLFKSTFKDHFIFYKPKQQVSGDFYWLDTKTAKDENGNALSLFAVADCTGHGVPGAMVSVVCTNALNRAVREYRLSEPGEILAKARDIVVKTFALKDQHVMDGMDISFCSLNHNTRELKWAGANNALWYAEDAQELHEIKANKQAIGVVRNPEPYTTHSLSLKPNTRIYLFTDGYADQFGGNGSISGKRSGKKFKSASLKKLLLSLSDKPMNAYPAVLNTTLINWMGDLEQIDDICLIGIEV